MNEYFWTLGFDLKLERDEYECEYEYECECEWDECAAMRNNADE